MKTPRVSVVIPTMNEEQTIARVVRGLRTALKKYSYEIIVVDKSVDGTAALAKKAGAIVVVQNDNGYGDAYLQGFALAHGGVLAMLDGDGTYAPSEITRLITPILRNKADIVIGNRFAGMERGAMTLLNRFGNALLTRMVNLFFGSRVRDSQSGYRAFSARAFKSMRLCEAHMPFATEMIAEAQRAGLRIIEVPISYSLRGGRAKLNPVRDGLRHAGAAVRIVRDYDPLRVFGIAGIVFLLTGFYFGFEVLNAFGMTGRVYVGRALLSIFLSTVGVFSIFTALILDSIKSMMRR